MSEIRNGQKYQDILECHSSTVGNNICNETRDDEKGLQNIRKRGIR